MPREPFEAIDWDEWESSHPNDRANQANAAIQQDRVEHEKWARSIGVACVTGDHDLVGGYACPKCLDEARAERDRLRELVGEAAECIAFYAAMGMPRPTHSCDVDVRFQIDGGDTARQLLPRLQAAIAAQGSEKKGGTP